MSIWTTFTLGVLFPPDILHTGYSIGDLVVLVIADRLKKARDVITHLITFDIIFVLTSERQSPKSSGWTASGISRINTDTDSLNGFGEHRVSNVTMKVGHRDHTPTRQRTRSGSNEHLR